MTIIAYDGKSIAVDSIACSVDMKSLSRKYVHYPRQGDQPETLYLWHGSHDLGIRLASWHRDGALITDWPTRQYTDDWAGLIVVLFTQSHQLLDIFEYEREPFRERVYAPFLAWGSGASFAMGAMAAGANAKRAAEIACELCTTCGGPVVSWDFMPS